MLRIIDNGESSARCFHRLSLRRSDVSPGQYNSWGRPLPEMPHSKDQMWPSDSESSASEKPAYACCGQDHPSVAGALMHWLNRHFLPIKGSERAATPHGRLPRFYTSPNPCRDNVDVANVNIALVSRADFLLRQQQSLLARRNQSLPRHKSPEEYADPYDAAVALSSDFMDVVMSRSVHYHLFLSLVLDRNTSEIDGEIANHLAYLPLWVDFRYQTLPKVVCPLFAGKVERPAPPPPKRRLGRPSKRPSANPPAKQVGGVRLTCPFLPCRTSYSSMAGLKLHMLENHLKQEHFHCPDPDSHYACPTPTCNDDFSSSDKLRMHILEAHSHFKAH